MKPTALGALVTGVGWIAILVGFLVGSLAPALVGATLLLGVESARWRLGRTPVQVARHAPQRMELGACASIETEATAQHALPLRVEDDADVPLRVLSRQARAGRGHASHRMEVEATDIGTMRWRSVMVHVADPWGLHETRRIVGLRGTLQVSPEAEWVAAGRLAGKRRTVATLRHGRRALDPVPELDTVRPFQPGDRLRDIDWPRSSRQGTLHTRIRRRVMPRPITVLLDATASMRMHRRRAKITTAARLAYAVAAAAQAAGVGAQVVAFDERGASGSLGGRDISQALQRLSRLDAPIPVATISQAGNEPLRREEREVLGSLAALSGGEVPSAPPLQTALELVAGAEARFVVAVLDAEQDPETAETTVLRLRKAGHDVLLVVPATGAHHDTRRDATGARLQELIRYRTRREVLARRLQSSQVGVLAMGPRDVEPILEEVMRRAQ